MTRALIVVDVQNDFCEGGSLAVTGGADVATRISQFVQANHLDYKLVLASMDHHINPGSHFSDSPDYVDSWPKHCVAGTPGADFHPNLDPVFERDLVDGVIRKGEYEAAYSAFDGKYFRYSLVDVLHYFKIDEVHVVGIATDYCVEATALDSATLGFKTRVFMDLTAAVHPENVWEVEDRLKASGVLIE